MKQKTKEFNYYDENEFEMLKEKLDQKELFILGFLKGFDREKMKKWTKDEIWEY
jgi:hypothetical protein